MWRNSYFWFIYSLAGFIWHCIRAVQRTEFSFHRSSTIHCSTYGMVLKLKLLLVVAKMGKTREVLFIPWWPRTKRVLEATIQWLTNRKINVSWPLSKATKSPLLTTKRTTSTQREELCRLFLWCLLFCSYYCGLIWSNCKLARKQSSEN